MNCRQRKRQRYAAMRSALYIDRIQAAMSRMALHALPVMQDAWAEAHGPGFHGPGLTPAGMWIGSPAESGR